MNEKINDKYVYIDESSLSSEICDTIINKFNDNPSNKRKGVCGQGYNINVKCSTDYIITHNDNNWTDIYQLLLSNLHNSIIQYETQINISQYTHFKNTYLKSTVFQLQHYSKNNGKFLYHNDSSIYFNKKEERTLVYMWYLNDVTVGSETDFIDFNIKPTAGKLVLFPSTWTYPHCANIPISNDKYIITGWIVTPILDNQLLNVQPNISNNISKNNNKSSEEGNGEISNITIDDRFIQRFIHKDIFCTMVCDWLIHDFNISNNSHEIPPNIIDIDKILHVNYFLLSNFQVILNEINTFYNNKNRVIINYINIVKYNVFEKVNTEMENDTSILQIRIALNENSNYDGGSITFNTMNTMNTMNTHLEKGSMLVFLNNTDYTHNDILSGEQYVLIAGITL